MDGGTAMPLTLNNRQAYVTRVLPDGRAIDVVPLTFGRARIYLSRDLDTLCVDDEW